MRDRGLYFDLLLIHDFHSDIHNMDQLVDKYIDYEYSSYLFRSVRKIRYSINQKYINNLLSLIQRQSN